MRRPYLFALVVLAGLALDQASKAFAFGELPDEGVPLWEDVLHLKPALNRGVAFSLFADWPLAVLLVTAAAIGALWWWYLHGRAKARRVVLCAQALLLTGATGNFIDRLRFAGVRDFFDFRPELPLIGHWAIFNVADVCITVGVGLFVLAEFTRPEEASADPAPQAEPVKSEQ
ncbi:MAG: signal peptidase II [Planctomycetota bacterium]|nr:signal peptidase II [Planctomycetota bacterium]